MSSRLLTYRKEGQEKVVFKHKIEKDYIHFKIEWGNVDLKVYEKSIPDTQSNRESLDKIYTVLTALADALDTSADFIYRAKKEIEFAFAEEFGANKENAVFENNFRYHAPKEGQPEIYELIRNELKRAAYLIDEHVPNSREKSTAITKLEEAMFWSNAGIARN